jgi:hypothetical protein
MRLADADFMMDFEEVREIALEGGRGDEVG